MSDPSSTVIGIDFGTSNSRVAVLRHGRPMLIPNALGELLTPSAVSVDDGGFLLVGQAARERAGSAPASTAQAFKRWMGSERRFTLAYPGGAPRSFRAEELAALVMATLKADAEVFLGRPVARAVIAVPACFNEAQRGAMWRAARLAGLSVERLVDEPGAAGLAHARQRGDGGPRRCLVVDLGGGGLDVSLTEERDGAIVLRASAGERQLGGEDFTETLGRLFAARCGLAGAERDAWWRESGWWHAAEQAKRELGERPSASLALRWRGRTLAASLGRDEMEQACRPLLERLCLPIAQLLSQVRSGAAAAPDEVLLIGGAARMPMVRQAVVRLCQPLPVRTIDTGLAIAQGAALQAAPGGSQTPPGLPTEAVDAAMADRLRTMKRHPRDEQENRYLVERARRLYEARRGEERLMLLSWLAVFEVTLEMEQERQISRARQELREALNGVEERRLG